MYAAGTIIYTPLVKNPTSIQIQNYQSDINILYRWCYDKKLSINSKKTKVMILGTNYHTANIKLPQQLYINHSDLEIVSTYKYLGMTLNSSISPNENFNKILGKVSTKINTLSYPRKYLNHQVLLQIYKSTILPIKD